MEFSNEERASNHDDSDDGQIPRVAKSKSHLAVLEKIVGQLLESMESHGERLKALEDKVNGLVRSIDGTSGACNKANVLYSNTATLVAEVEEGLKEV